MATSDPSPIDLSSINLGVHEDTMRRWEAEGFINAKRLPGKLRRLTPADTKRIMEQGPTKGAYDQAIAACLTSLESTPEEQ